MSDARRLRIGYLLGTSHCGSTLMAFLMDTHRDIASVGEVGPNRRISRTNSDGFRCSCGEVIGDCSFWSEVFQSVQQQGWDFSPANWSHRYRYDNSISDRLLMKYTSSALLEHLRVAALAVAPFHRRRIARTHQINAAFVKAVLDARNATVFFDTTKSLTRLRFLVDVPQFDVYVVRILRDVRAFALSMRRKGWSSVKAASHWKQYQLAADRLCSQLPAEQVLELRYEDICRETEPALQQLHEFLGVSASGSPAIIDPADHHVIGNSMRLRGPLQISLDEKWRRELSDADVEEVDRVAGSLNARFGYERAALNFA